MMYFVIRDAIKHECRQSRIVRVLYSDCVWGGEMFINEQINRTRAKSQQIVVQDYSHAYNTPFCI